MTLHTIEGIIYMLEIETGKSQKDCESDLKRYLEEHKKYHNPNADKIELARGYLVHILQQYRCKKYE